MRQQCCLFYALCRFCWWPVATTVVIWTALNSSSPPPPPGFTLVLSPHPGPVWGALHWTIKLLSQVQTQTMILRYYTFNLTSITISYTTQVEGRMEGTTGLDTWTRCWNMTRSLESGRPLGSWRWRGPNMQFLSLITTPLRSTVLDDWNCSSGSGCIHHFVIFFFYILIRP